MYVYIYHTTDCGTSATTQIESCRSLRTPSAASTYAAAAAATPAGTHMQIIFMQCV